MSGGQEELQELSQQLQEVESRMEAIESQLQSLQLQKSDMDEAIEAIETLETGSNVQVPIGGDTYVRATIDDISEVVVGIGGGYATERTEAEAAELLEHRKETLDNRIEQLTETLAELQEQGQELGVKAQQHLQQQRQGQGLGQ